MKSFELKYAILAIGIAIIFLTCEDPKKVDEIAPTVIITSPLTGTTVDGVLTIKVEASDNESVLKVEFVIDGVLENTDEVSPWEYFWDTRDYANGNEHSILAKAYDLENNVGLSSLVSVSVQNNNTSPVAHYPFNGSAIDVSANSNDGTEHGGVGYSTDRFGNANSALLCDGVDDFIDIDNLDSFQEQTFSISGWFQPFSMGTGNNSSDWIINTPSGGVATVPEDYYDLDKILLFGWGVDERDGGGTRHTVQYPDYVHLNAWYQFTLNVDGDLTWLYINGVLVDETGIADGQNEYPQSRIGASGYVGSEQGNFNGKIDDILIYNRLVTPTEVDSIYHVGGWPTP